MKKSALNTIAYLDRNYYIFYALKTKKGPNGPFLFLVKLY